MITLALSTTSSVLSVALVDGPRVLARSHERIGRGHAEALVPTIDQLLAGQRPKRILVDIGPGSYTGIRIGIAAARALGLAWSVPVAGVSALSLVAAQALAAEPALDHVLALVDAGRGQAVGALLARDLVSPPPAFFRQLPQGVPVAGEGAGLLCASAIPIHADAPDAACAGRVPAPALHPPTALYLDG